MSRFWVKSDQVKANIPEESDYFVVFKKVTSPTNEHTLLATILPLVAANDSIHFVFFPENESPQKKAVFLANLNTMILDYISRQKLGGLNFNFWVFEQLPILSPEHYTPGVLDIIVPKVLELTYTAWDLEPFARDVLNNIGEETWNRWFPENPVSKMDQRITPFRWDEERRAVLRAELDAIYAHLYSISRQDLDYIVDTFPIVKRKDKEKYGTYRTKDLILQYFDKYTGKFTSGEPSTIL